MMFTCPFVRYRYIRLLFKSTQAMDVFLKKIDELFSGMPNVFGIANDILIACFDEQVKDHDETLESTLGIQKGNFKALQR